MRKIFFAVTIFALWLNLCLGANDNWSVAKSTHFIVYYKEAQLDFIEELIEKSEYYYDEIADDLGFRRFEFWLWDNRAKVYIYDDAQDYQDATKQPGWSMGCAIIKEKTIHTFPYAKGFFETILPHEIGHIIFREFVGFDNPAIPIWLDEGVASYQENRIYSGAHRIVRDALAKGELISLEDISKMNPHSIKEEESVSLFYAEAVSIIDYLVKEFGQDSFILFCQKIRDERDFDKALSSTYPFKNIRELSLAWQEYLEYE